MKNKNLRLKNLRTSKKLSQAALAEKIGISQRAVSYYESGKDTPSLEILISIADFFNVSLDYLVGRSNDPQRP